MKKPKLNRFANFSAAQIKWMIEHNKIVHPRRDLISTNRAIGIAKSHKSNIGGRKSSRKDEASSNILDVRRWFGRKMW